MDILEKIRNGTGRQIYNLMKEIERRRREGGDKPEFREWWTACVNRAEELNTARFGDWSEAKKKLDSMAEPKVEFGERNTIETYVTPINGYPCVYCKSRGEGGHRSRVYITNPKTNTMYLREFGNATQKHAEDIFGKVIN